MQKMPARSKQITKYRRRDKDMEPIVEIEKMKMVLEKTKDWGHVPQEEEEDRTRCWGTCDPVPRPDDLDEILNWAVVAEIEIT